MSKRHLVHLFRVVIAFTAVSANADQSVVSGRMLGNEPLVEPVVHHAFCDFPVPLPYQVVGPLRVSASGSYEVTDAGHTDFSLDSVASWYDAEPDPVDLEANRIANTDDRGTLDLVSGTDYYLLVQPWCVFDPRANGVWAQHLDGPGTVSGPQAIVTPGHWSGEWIAGSDTTNISLDEECPDSYYNEFGPVQVSRSGTWYLSNASAYVDQPVLVGVYDGGFDPANPANNQIGITSGFPIVLQAGRDYTFVVQPLCNFVTGSWYYVLFPPAPFEFNGAMSGAFYNPDTSGQGVLLDVDPEQNFVFAAWFTWATQPPAGATTPQAVGDPSHRWLTFQGDYQTGDASIDLTVYSSTGGVFDDPAPVNTDPVGTAVLDMESCFLGELRYSLDSGEEGVSPMVRLLFGNVPTCESSYEGPGVLYD